MLGTAGGGQIVEKRAGEGGQEASVQSLRPRRAGAGGSRHIR